MLQCFLLYLVMARVRLYPEEVAHIHFEDEFGGNVYIIVFTESNYMCYCNFINIYWKFILLCHLLLFL